MRACCINASKSLLVYLFLFLFSTSCSAKTGQSPIPDKNLRNIRAYRDSAKKYENSGDKKTALKYLNIALEQSHTKNLMEQEAIALKDIAMLLKDEDADQSLIHLQNALNIARTIKHKKLQADIYQAMSSVYKLKENYKDALSALESHHRLLDSLLVRERSREIVLLKAENRSKIERSIVLTISLAVIVVLVIGFLYSRKARSLNKEMKSAMLIKDKLFSIVGHDLRGPAGSMMQAMSLFASGAFTEEEEQKMRILLKKQSESLYNAIETLFQWSNTQLNGVQILPQHFEPASIIDKNIRLLSGQASQKNITITNNIVADEKILIYADPNHFDYIVRNLLSNAIKFSHVGGDIIVASKIENGKMLFSVSDNGIGISPEKQKQFETNNMELAFGTIGENGIGLGLSLAREFIKANKGEIWLVSEENKGTTMFFTLNLNE
jgi:signal transduction histidine kinase